MTPEEKLCSRWWRLGHSAWLLISILSVGIFTWVGFLFIGIQAKNRYWLISAGGWGLATLVYIIASGQVDGGTKEAPIKSFAADMQALGLFLLWIGGMIHSFTVRRAWLRWRAQKGAAAWYASPAVPQVPQESQFDASALDRALRDESPLLAPQVASQVAPPAAPPVTSSHQIDLNHGSRAELKTALDLDDAWADWIIATRDRLGGFSELDQLMTEAQMPPHMFLAMRNRIAPPAPFSGQAPNTAAGRRLDL
jgi:DNA uptake protein ComE-like DNA-binding protein